MKRITKNMLYNMYFKQNLTLKEIGKIYNITHSAVAKKMDICGLKRRDRSESTYAFYNKTEWFHMTSNGHKLLKNIGLMLYWCEGTHYTRKNKNDGTLAFTNTNVDMLRIWLKFLRNICNLDRRKIKIRIYIHRNQDEAALRKYWSKTLKIPICNFENVSYTKKNSTRPWYKGTVKIKVHNIKLFNIIKSMISKTAEKVLMS